VTVPDTIERTPLQIALTQACEFARAHGIAGRIRPDDFGIQRSDAGLTNATYVDGDHVVTVLVDRHGGARFGVAELDWIHHESDEDREPCDYCEVDDTDEFDGDYFHGLPLVDVYLPGDAPAEAVSAHG